MHHTEPPEVPLRPEMDARVARTRDAVMQAAMELLVEGGPSALTVDAVVARSGVAKSTVYRHWADRDALVADVFNVCAPQLVEPDAGLPFEVALRQLVVGALELMTDERWKRLVPALLLLKSEKSAIAALDDQMNRDQADVIGNVLQRGVDEGVLRPEVADDLPLAITLLVGPVLMAGLIEVVPVDQVLADRVVEQFLAANRAAPA
jgi:AcrR family transcriptional regulator